MKTQVIQLELHDDVVSVRDKISWTKTPRILLVYPRRGSVLSRTLDLRLLQRHASTYGAQVGLVSNSSEIRLAAGELGIPVFTTVAEAQKIQWPETARHRKPARRAPRSDFRQQRAEFFRVGSGWMDKPAIRIGSFIVGVIAILAVLILFIPSAEITLYPEFVTQSLTLSVHSGLDFKSVSITGDLPAYTITTVVSGSKTIPVSGHIKIADKKAEGYVVFSNLTNGLIGIPAGTVVRTNSPDPIRFITTQDGVVEAGVDKSLDIPVQAVYPGAEGNVQLGEIVIVEGSLGANLAVTNPVPFSGGTDRSVRAASSADYARLYSQLIEEMKISAAEELAGQLGGGDVLFRDTVKVNAVVSEEYFPAEGLPGDSLLLNLTMEYTGVYAASNDLQILATASLDAIRPNGYVPVTGTMTATLIGDAITDAEGMTSITLFFARYLEPELDPLTVARLVQGRTRANAVRLLGEEFQFSSSPVINMKPSWWPWLPLLQFRIAVVK